MRTGVAGAETDGPEDDDGLPVSHEVSIPAHEKAVLALGLDPKGSRMATGCMGGMLNLFDFNGMSEEKKAFRSLEPLEGHHIQAISFSITGGCILVVSSDSHARIYDRDGSSQLIQSTVNGDMYVRDMQHTKGHTQMLTHGIWHPFRQEEWLTSSLDGTLRLWDINAQPVGMDQQLPSIHVLKCVDPRGVCLGGAAGRTGGLHPTCCAYSPVSAKYRVAGCSDGSVQVFLEKPRYQKPDIVLRKAHTDVVTDVSFIKQGGVDNVMVTRSLDDTMKLWDCRMLSDAKGPLKSFTDLHAGHEKAGVCASPDGKYLCVGTAAQRNAIGKAALCIYDLSTLKQVRCLNFGARSPVRVAWPADLNQLVVSTTSGEIVMLYSPTHSDKGALHFVGKHARRKDTHQVEGTTAPQIFMMTDREDIQKFYSTGHGNMSRIRAGEARHSQKTLTPARPPQQDGALAASREACDFQAAVLKAGAKRLGFNSARGTEQDSQRALLAQDAKIGKSDSLMGSAYLKNQAPLDWSVEESEGDQRMQLAQGGDFCRKCGQKVCRCVDYSAYGINKKQKLR